jgi:hypothetical protein
MMEENVHVIRAYAGAFVKKHIRQSRRKKGEDRGGQKESCPGACAVVSWSPQLSFGAPRLDFV